MKKFAVAAVLFIFSFAAFASSQGHEEGLSAEAALDRLVKGNKRYYTGKMTHKNQGKKRQAQTAKKQQPFAVIVACSDSRVAPEILFDTGMGDLFVIRSAGNVVDDIAIGSIEYAVEHLGTKLVIVLGHERCGAVTAAVDNAKVKGHLTAVLKKIKPSVKKTKKEKSMSLVDTTVMKNVSAVVTELSGSKPVLKELVKSGELKIMGAYYDLDSGKVMRVRADK